jgi:Uma2 family endonuclease
MFHMSHPAEQHRDRYTYSDYLTWPDDTRWELIGGTAYAMAPAPTIRHQILVQNLAGLLSAYFRGKPCRPFVALTDVKLSEHDVVQPDLLVVCDRGKIGEAAILGAPEWAIEVLSPASESRDRREKRLLYERFAVPEYWIVSPSGFVEVYGLEPSGRYGAPAIASMGESVASLSFRGLVIGVDDIFEGIDVPRPACLQPPGAGSG